MQLKLLTAVFSLVSMLVVSGCAKITLAWADLSADGAVATPDVLGEFNGDGPVTSLSQWQASRAPALRTAFEKYVYGAFPDESTVSVLSARAVDLDAFGGLATLYESRLQASVRFGDTDNKTEVFLLNALIPNNAPNAPVVLMQTFCPRWDTIPHEKISRPKKSGGCGGAGSGLMRYIFGRYIATPPIEEILNRGYAIATIYPSEFVPDRRETGLAALAALSDGRPAGSEQWGAIAAWGFGYSWMVDALRQMPAISATKFIAYGHSRYGKAALVAAAYDKRINGVISHQSGTGGASLNAGKKGESIADITSSYPHWFAASYANAADRYLLPIDQHQLLALIAPRPILLGNARRDVWSDPNGAFRAAMGADAVYELYGVKGLDQQRLGTWRPDAELSFWIRPGTHGVVKEDWPAFLEFLDAHFEGNMKDIN